MYALKGDLVWAEEIGKLRTIENGYLVIDKNMIVGTSDDAPECDVIDKSGCLIIPGLADLHSHAPQYMYAGIWTDEELLTWLDRHTFPIESRYSDSDFAEKSYRAFVRSLVIGGTSRAVLFSTKHTDSTLMLMGMLEEAGIPSYVGKVNMDRCSFKELEETTEESIRETERWLSLCSFSSVKPIITPRFALSCSKELLSELGRISKSMNLPVQSHLDENISEIEEVKRMFPSHSSYAGVYDDFSLLTGKTIMAHAVHITDGEIELIKERGAFIAHAPSSNMNLSSGIAPVRKFIEAGIDVGLSTDVAGGSSLSMFRAITDSIQVSKLRSKIIEGHSPALSFEEAFYLATKGGGKFFGRTGSFETGFEADVLVIDDNFPEFVIREELSPVERLEYYSYRHPDENIIMKLCNGRKVLPEE